MSKYQNTRLLDSVRRSILSTDGEKISRPTRGSVLLLLVLLASLQGCSRKDPSSNSTAVSPFELNKQQNVEFLTRRSYAPWVLTSHDMTETTRPYLANGVTGYLMDSGGDSASEIKSGKYVGNTIVELPKQLKAVSKFALLSSPGYQQALDMFHGTLLTVNHGKAIKFSPPGLDQNYWPQFWNNSDVIVPNDPQAQQVLHVFLYDMASSVKPNGRGSLPPMGLSSIVYNGHIFWDADSWMFPALLVQHPRRALAFINYRYDRLNAAKENARKHGRLGAEFPWESAATGAEVAPGEFATERHVTADVGIAAWQYYQWTGDRSYLRNEGWKIIKACADYWMSRVSLGKDHKFHIDRVLSPDETAGLVDDDAYTNAAAKQCLSDAIAAEKALNISPSPLYALISDRIVIPTTGGPDGIIAEHSNATRSLMSKQADTALLIFPLGLDISAQAQRELIEYSKSHTISTGPAMTSCIWSIAESELQNRTAALNDFRNAYQPFMRGPFDSFSEKRTATRTNFFTGMSGCVESVLYGFAGIRVTSNPTAATKYIVCRASDGTTLEAIPHVPSEWKSLQIRGVKFRGHIFDLTERSDGNVIFASR